mgnify:CR=1 FL=1
MPRPQPITARPAPIAPPILPRPEAGAALVEHKDVKKIAFTGSTEVGRILRESGVPTIAAPLPSLITR